ncbi:hypothetical protein CAOG_04437 [Capsaspora owczarzaki ATCC 30864]|uniref:Peptidase S54 rhomboid domain-containing protein n=1 Tax=Capsaspora owczarzaki (strain ATCC 30864) TaxID=595528 RepID=A0A0D2VRW4_CAPO3|nr:hypothetical protein CAOG_04437 [Capsaspora owczarzaki ATCC 30864]KJE93682.1 hypothetical protein CAOG_004437 [Capsaspora owczarzaki ATCC 30864]|eukprot:XP_004348265.1 hypothetical protein CAOG_04437 [Capsaspora owczarzaki ATCC 30864]
MLRIFTSNGSSMTMPLSSSAALARLAMPCSKTHWSIRTVLTSARSPAAAVVMEPRTSASRSALRWFGTSAAGGPSQSRYTRATFRDPSGSSYYDESSSSSSGGRWSGGSHNRGWFRNFGNRLQPKTVVIGLVGLNCTVFALQHIGDALRSQRDYRLSNFLALNFTLHWDNIRRHRYWTMFTHALTHKDPMHLLMNMVGLYSFGLQVASYLSPARFLAVYFGAAGLGAAFELEYERRTQTRHSVIGASDAVLGLISLSVAMFPQSKASLFFLPIAIPTAIPLLGIVAYDLYRCATGVVYTASPAHLGGTAFGVLYYLLRLRGRR